MEALISSGADASQSNDLKKEVRAFDESNIGVKGLVDAGISKVPRIFHRPPASTQHHHTPSPTPHLTLPTIDLAEDRYQIVDLIRSASQTWGFFQVVNHGIPATVMEEMIAGGRRFYEQDTEVKKALYTRDRSRPFVYNSNYDIYESPHANWRDTFYCLMAPNPPDPRHVPQVCREILFEYSKHVKKLGTLLYELLSEALGLKPSHLEDMGIAEGLAVGCHCYPECPEPELTLGSSKHADKYFLTVLLQDHIGGLQVLHDDSWVDVPPLPGALVVNIGDLLQLISNDKFKSVEHRVLANRVGPRISVPSFFCTKFGPNTKLYGPISELLSETNPPKFRETTVSEFLNHYDQRGLIGTSALTHFRI